MGIRTDLTSHISWKLYLISESFAQPLAAYAAQFVLALVPIAT